MKIAILGFGRMGSWLARALARHHDVTVFEIDAAKRNAEPGLHFLGSIGELAAFAPEMLVNAVTLPLTQEAFQSALPGIPRACILCDMTSIKGPLPEFYRQAGFPFVSIHPMFGPTFADVKNPQKENAVIVSESDREGKSFFRDFFTALGVHSYEYSFAEHDRLMAYSLTLPFVSSLVFSSCVTIDTVPGTTFRRHLDVARGLLNEDDSLLTEILFNPDSLGQLDLITGRLNFLRHIVQNRDGEEAHRFFASVRNNLAQRPARERVR